MTRCYLWLLSEFGEKARYYLFSKVVEKDVQNGDHFEPTYYHINAEYELWNQIQIHRGYAAGEPSSC